MSKYKYELIGFKDGKSVRFETAETLEEARDTILGWKLEKELDRIDLEVVTAESRLCHEREVYTIFNGRWHKRYFYVGEDERKEVGK